MAVSLGRYLLGWYGERKERHSGEEKVTRRKPLPKTEGRQMTPTEAKLLILASDAAEYQKAIDRAALPGLSVAASHTVDGESRTLQECDILFGSPDLLCQALPHARRLRWAQSTWAGITPLLAEGLRRDYLLTGVKGVFGPLMAEYVLCHILAHERRFLARYHSQLARQWDETPPGTLRGKTIGIMGLGSIGREIARVVSLLGMKTVGFSRSQRSCPDVERCFLPTELADFVRDLDYLVAVLPDTPATRGLIDATLLSAMRDRAVLINVGRGSVIDEPALVRALASGQLGGAVLDVLQEEPLPASHPLWQTPNTILTCHTAALSSAELITPIFIDNYQRWRRGAPLRHRVDFARGY
jgi:phosphoglycerate dehydrogenase-like enzyme